MPLAPVDVSRTAVRRPGLAARFAILAAVLCAEKSVLNFFVDFDAAQEAQGLGALVRTAQHVGFRFAVTLAAALALFGYVCRRDAMADLDTWVRPVPVSLPRLLLHAALVLPLAPLSYLLYGNQGVHLPLELLLVLWLGLAGAAAAALGTALAPWSLWRRTAHALGGLWLYAVSAAALATCTMQFSQMLWSPVAGITFECVRWTLAPLVPELHADPATLILHTGNFAVQVSELCSGLEGAGLMLAFCGAWLLYFRSEYVFPRALVLLPVGVLLIFLLNILRIAALTLIGHAGFPSVAIYGFHSQAGWIAFNCAAAAVAIVSRRSSWLSRTASHVQQHGVANPTAAYLMPFLAALAAGILGRAVSGSFQTWYPLQVVAGAIGLWHYRHSFATLDWRFTWRSVVAGVVVFALWIAISRLTSAPSTIPEALRVMPSPLRATWLIFRVAGSVLVVPLAEELAYRGYLLRRLVAADFASVHFQGIGRWPLLLSAAAFGVVHGSMWLPGVFAGLTYGLLVVRSGRIGEPMAAHATSNALIAACVLLGDHWQLW